VRQLRVPLLVKEERFGQLILFGVITAVGVFMLATAGQYTLRTEDGGLGGGFLPLATGAALALLAGAQFIAAATQVRRLAHDRQALEATEAGRQAEAADLDVFGRTATQRLRQLATVIAAIFASAALVPLLGLLGSLLLLSLFISAVVERRVWWASALVSVASVGLVYLIFDVLLALPLPAGLLLDAVSGA
jgi:tripartite tricarboxylate transporter TctB family protein